MIGLVITGVPVVWQTVCVALARRFATDVIASLAIVTAVVLVQPLAGLVIVLMQTGGEALERFAEGRASAAVRALEEDAPRIAHRLAAEQGPRMSGDGQDIAVGEIAVKNLLLVRPGEMVPCDAEVIEGSSHCDTSRLTGEPLPCRVGPGATLSSGIINLDGPLVVRASKTAGDSQYAKIVELVRSSQASKAPLQRLADRYAAWFTPVTLVVCAVAYFASGDVDRVLAVLVVATPCPLILAIPIAIIGGVNRAARRLIVVRHGGAMEQLAEVTTAVFDKTGTLTVGMPMVDVVLAAPGFGDEEVLTSAAAVERGSGHLLARSVVETAGARHLPTPPAVGVTEAAGQGIRGTVGGHDVCVGARGFVQGCTPAASNGLSTAAADRGGLRAYVAIDGRFAGTIEFADRLRPGMAELLADLRGAGIERCVILSGDSQAHTDAIAAQAGITEARGELLPEEKVEIIGDMVRGGTRVVMVGDGTNDAPALGTATVGIAMAGHGGGITAEAADIVILNDDLGRVAEAIHISRRTLRIARQSIWAGLGLSAAAMVIAAAGYVPPAIGALLQEGIDVAVILNALRTSRSVQPPTK
jgi:heavy metal translocating P-type ATPase